MKSVSGFVWSLSAAVHRRWRRRRKPEAAPPILVVGSTRAGGTGKTDLVGWIADRHPHLAVLAHPTGDEDAWLRRRFGDRVFADRDLLRAWNRARAAGFGGAVSDGGLQDPALEDCPALRLEVDDAPRRWSDLLPWGPYRERAPRPRGRILDLVWGRDLGWSLDPASAPEPGTAVVAAAGIARPSAFFADLEAAGLVLLDRLAFGDHHRFDSKEVARARGRHPGAAWVITEKDAAREGWLPEEGSIVARRNLSIPDGLAARLDAWVAGQSRNRMDVTPRG